MHTDFPETIAIGLLIACEEALGELYTVYAAQDAELAPFWTGLSSEERTHATWLRNLLKYLQQGDIRFQENRFQPDTFRTFLHYVQSRITEARARAIPPFAALSIAVDIEGEMVEQCFFEVLDGDRPELRRTLTLLASATEKHRQVVKAKWEAYRPE